MTTFKFKKGKFPQTKDSIIKLINRDLEEINSLSDRDLISIYDFFKALCSNDIIFVTQTDSIVWGNKKELEKNTKIKIKTMKQIIAG
jgi:hypothetical protein